MKKRVRLPTILGMFILLSGIIAGIFLINSRQEYKLSANVEAVPKNIRFSNITNSSITISWTTDIMSNGFIKWGNSTNLLNEVSPEKETEKSFIHTTNITDLTTNSNIFFKINSDGKDYDNGGIPWQAKTNNIKVNSSSSLIASGNLLAQDGTNPSKSLVYLSINGTVLSNTTSAEGSFVIPISNFLENISDTTVIEISANSGVGTAQASIYPHAISAIPTMVIGKTYDFRSLEVNESNTIPESLLSVPESVEISSRFEITKPETITDANPVTLESVDEGEIINTVDPEFFGSGPANTKIKVSVESELQEVALSTNSKGVWKWSPPNNLEPGEHKVTISWTDTTGVLRNLTRTFVVQASEGPAFEATPSASLTPSPVASTASTPKATVAATAIATAPPTPETGSLTPTIGLFIMGIGLLLSSVYVWNRQDAY